MWYVLYTMLRGGGAEGGMQADEEKCQEDKSAIIRFHNKLDKCVICG